MGRGAIALGALLFVAGGGVLGYVVMRDAKAGMQPAAREAMARAMTGLDAEIKVARSAVRERATTLSKLLAVRSIVLADEVSAKDSLRTGELQFSPGPGEVIELGRVKAGTATPLLIQPDGAMSPTRNGVPGSYAMLLDDTLVITEVNEVVPASERDAIEEGVKVTGYVMVSRPLDLGPAIAGLEAAQIQGRFEVAGPAGPVTRAIGNPPSEAPTQVQPLPSEPGAQLVIALPAVRKVSPAWLGLGGGVTALGIVLLVVGFRRRRRDDAPGLRVQPTEPGSAPSRLDSFAQIAVAAGTPSLVDGTAATSSPTGTVAAPGAMIGRWEVIRRLGSGGMADVYLARSRGEAGFEKLVAIKVMHGHLARNPRAVAHFLDEARLAARINHPNVVAIQDLGKIGDDYVIVMDYIEGVDLERLLASARSAGRPVPIAVALGILCRICDGLTAAHRATTPDGTPLGIIHRDVKSANVLVSRQGGVMVVDFGIAKAATQSHNTIAGETKGTPSMMAPEQRIGEQVDVRADVYSVAAVAYEVLTGSAVNLDLATLAHLGVANWPHLPPPSELRPDLPRELDAILLTAMSFDRERRPASCAAFEETLERAMKAHALSCADKDIARWIDAELRMLTAGFQDDAISPTTPAGLS